MKLWLYSVIAASVVCSSVFIRYVEDICPNANRTQVQSILNDADTLVKVNNLFNLLLKANTPPHNQAKLFGLLDLFSDPEGMELLPHLTNKSSFTVYLAIVGRIRQYKLEIDYFVEEENFERVVPSFEPIMNSLNSFVEITQTLMTYEPASKVPKSFLHSMHQEAVKDLRTYIELRCVTSLGVLYLILMGYQLSADEGVELMALPAEIMHPNAVVRKKWNEYAQLCLQLGMTLYNPCLSLSENLNKLLKSTEIIHGLYRINSVAALQSAFLCDFYNALYYFGFRDNRVTTTKSMLTKILGYLLKGQKRFDIAAS